MAKTFTVEVVTPTSIRTFNEVSHVRASGVDGQFGVLPRHIPAIFALKPGKVKIDSDEQQQLFAVSEGYCEIQRERILLLVETAEFPEEIDVKRAQSALERARKILSERPDSLKFSKAMAAMSRAKNRLRIADKK